MYSRVMAGVRERQKLLFYQETNSGLPAVPEDGSLLRGHGGPKIGGSSSHSAQPSGGIPSNLGMNALNNAGSKVGTFNFSPKARGFGGIRDDVSVVSTSVSNPGYGNRWSKMPSPVSDTNANGNRNVIRRISRIAENPFKSAEDAFNFIVSGASAASNGNKQENKNESKPSETKRSPKNANRSPGATTPKNTNLSGSDLIASNLTQLNVSSIRSTPTADRGKTGFTSTRFGMNRPSRGETPQFSREAQRQPNVHGDFSSFQHNTRNISSRFASPGLQITSNFSTYAKTASLHGSTYGAANDTATVKSAPIFGNATGKPSLILGGSRKRDMHRKIAKVLSKNREILSSNPSQMSSLESTPALMQDPSGLGHFMNTPSLASNAPSSPSMNRFNFTFGPTPEQQLFNNPPGMTPMNRNLTFADSEQTCTFDFSAGGATSLPAGGGIENNMQAGANSMQTGGTSMQVPTNSMQTCVNSIPTIPVTGSVALGRVNITPNAGNTIMNAVNQTLAEVRGSTLPSRPSPKAPVATPKRVSLDVRAASPVNATRKTRENLPTGVPDIHTTLRSYVNATEQALSPGGSRNIAAFSPVGSRNMAAFSTGGSRSGRNDFGKPGNDVGNLEISGSHIQIGNGSGDGRVTVKWNTSEYPYVRMTELMTGSQNDGAVDLQRGESVQRLVGCSAAQRMAQKITINCKPQTENIDDHNRDSGDHSRSVEQSFNQSARQSRNQSRSVHSSATSTPNHMVRKTSPISKKPTNCDTDVSAKRPSLKRSTSPKVMPHQRERSTSPHAVMPSIPTRDEPRQERMDPPVSIHASAGPNAPDPVSSESIDITRPSAAMEAAGRDSAVRESGVIQSVTATSLPIPSLTYDRSMLQAAVGSSKVGDSIGLGTGSMLNGPPGVGSTTLPDQSASSGSSTSFDPRFSASTQSIALNSMSAEEFQKGLSSSTTGGVPPVHNISISARSNGLPSPASSSPGGGMNKQEIFEARIRAKVQKKHPDIVPSSVDVDMISNEKFALVYCVNPAGAREMMYAVPKRK